MGNVLLSAVASQENHSTMNHQSVKDIFNSTDFLVADTQLFERLCPSVRPFVRNDPSQKGEKQAF